MCLVFECVPVCLSVSSPSSRLSLSLCVCECVYVFFFFFFSFLFFGVWAEKYMNKVQVVTLGINYACILSPSLIYERFCWNKLS